jgi:diguanylate cyclase (GGDEF)-like protein
MSASRWVGFALIAAAVIVALGARAIADSAPANLDTVVFVVATGVMFTLSHSIPLRSSHRRERVRSAVREALLTQERERSAFQVRLDGVLAMAQTDESAFDVVERAVAEGAPDAKVELLVSDSSRAHFHRVRSTHVGSECGCGVGSPSECPAARSGQMLRFASSASLEACPVLARRTGEPVEAVCIPMSMTGRGSGILHAIAPAANPMGDESLQRLEIIARQCSTRIELVTMIAQTRQQANTDSLTGLINRRSLENEARWLTQESKPFAVVLADLDHFKDLNDTYGHDMGDRALRLFSRTLRNSVRERDIVARYGGEEFVALLPDVTASSARDVLDRVRLELIAAVGDGQVPGFTFSAGIVDTSLASGLGDLISMADELLLRAKREGRDRIIVADSTDGQPSPDRARQASEPHRR